MRIPINWLKEYVKLPGKLTDLTDKLTMAGHMLDKLDKVNNNIVIDLELRGNRADCYSILGIAREVSAIFKTPVNYPKIFNKASKAPKLNDIKLKADTNYLRRVMIATISDIKLTPSPLWLKQRLEEYGVPSINNIVDLSNYVMIETGQPLHTFDFDRVGKNLTIRQAKKGEQMTTFLEETINLTEDDLVWANQTSVLSIAGAIGGKVHSISNETKNVLLEGASYNQANIRRSVHRHNLLTDAGIRHEKNLDPNLVEFGIYRFLELIKENKWGKIENNVLDYYPNVTKPWKLSLNFDYLNSLSGSITEPKKVVEILKRLDFKILKEDLKDLEVACPNYRTDVKSEEDLIEEVLRIDSYDKIPSRVLSLEVPKDITLSYINQEKDLKDNLTSIGFDEVISLPFVKEDMRELNKSLINSGSPVKVVNRPSPDIEEMRMTMLPNLLEFTQKIINERGTEVRLFEIGKIYFKKTNKYHELRKAGIIYWSKGNANFFKFKGYIESLFSKMNLKNFKFSTADLPITNITNSYNITSSGQVVALGGEIEDCYYLEIDLDSLLSKNLKPSVNLWPKYPPQIEDLTFVIPERTKIGEVVLSIKLVDDKIAEVELKDIYKDSYTFRIWYQDKNKTLENDEVEKIREKIIKELNHRGVRIKN
ncbi:MAG: Phenylalanine-tRNA ligase beta subunit [Candidatus Woesebacteria bacterium GW2011_GWB1_39_12]|uniref:phenylalanine--tRNA ligase n=2 Tax=Candidatus Woeseibacteriota TaxID=1752722 RepID=A0A0G0MEJ8_9BACT|nr:MAG: Phenylalanine-tRNA ligase beta subunit [Candidatus Woesebacteria bacterium GW2011_GWA1_39_12]KKR01881.1 MAG: Phenylalanine-tRNA ligase beta subunit [Candidatus Woesebacteria bacterium GW2011_GWB1_39_12]